MSVPKPPASIDNACTVVHDNTLYAFTPDAFISIPLEKNAKWKKLPPGVKVTGATCVGSTPPDASQAGFYVVGGQSDTADYPGLQKYTYSTGNWTTIPISEPQIKNRQRHSSTYIPADDAILLYGGNVGGAAGGSTTTFTVGASPPYTVRSYGPIVAPAASSPILGSWSNADAFMVGTNDPQSAEIWLFNPNAGWRLFVQRVALQQKDSSSMQAVLVTGSDTSKTLITFDFSQSPTAVKRFTLQDEKGQPVYDSKAVTRRDVDGSHSETKRGLSLGDWPEYNATLAPTSTRQNFAIAQGTDGMVVFSGGNKENPLAIFNVEKNSWMNTTALLGDGKQKALTASTTTTASTSSTSTVSSTTSTLASSTTTTPAATTTAAALPPAAPSTDSGPSSDAILGITLGTIAGFLALLGIILLLLRRHKKRHNHAETGQSRDAKPASPIEKDMISPMSVPAAKGHGHFRGHYPQASQESYSSMAILMGRMNKDKSNLSRKMSNDTFRSSTSSLHKQFKSKISKPIPQMTEHPALAAQDDRGVAFDPAVAAPRPRNNRPMEPNDGTRRSSGWNRYWSGGSALQILGFGGQKRNTIVSEQSSHYSENTGTNNHTSRVTQDSATVPPLNFDRGLEGRPSVNSVNSGSPVVAQYNSKLPAEGMSGKIERPVSPVSSAGYSSGIPESINDAWDPADGKPWGADRAPSSAYTGSYQYGASLTPSAAARQAPSGVSKQPQLAMAATSSDMSWLNLGDQSRARGI
ncbi:Heat shock protein 16 [Purpureocillium lavendulum]|uniref:Heat shock protein 16 n=1 Tax=Purpureocillium lavendulum TaxID=1247861 RepID=A0AB34G3I2_9HYPO|nr:Heat shock protein 16 [Purpureocillium lavendulum]